MHLGIQAFGWLQTLSWHCGMRGSVIRVRITSRCRCRVRADVDEDWHVEGGITKKDEGLRVFWRRLTFTVPGDGMCTFEIFTVEDVARNMRGRA